MTPTGAAESTSAFVGSVVSVPRESPSVASICGVVAVASSGRSSSLCHVCIHQRIEFAGTLTALHLAVFVNHLALHRLDLLVRQSVGIRPNITRVFLALEASHTYLTLATGLPVVVETATKHLPDLTW